MHMYGPQEDDDEAAREHEVVDEDHPRERKGALEEQLAGGADLCVWCVGVGAGARGVGLVMQGEIDEREPLECSPS